MSHELEFQYGSIPTQCHLISHDELATLLKRRANLLAGAEILGILPKAGALGRTLSRNWWKKEERSDKVAWHEESGEEGTEF